MADPLTIIAFSGGVTKLAWKVGTTLFTFANEVKSVDDSLQSFATEITSLSRILQAVTSALNVPHSQLARESAETVAEKDIRSALFGAIEDLRLYLEKLRQKLEEIQRNQNDKNLFRQAIKALELRLKKDDVNNLRSSLRTHQLSLNTALVLVQLHSRVQILDQEQHDLRPAIHYLITMLKKLPGPADFGEIFLIPASEQWVNVSHILQLQTLATKVLSDASQVAESTTGSERSARLSSEKRSRIDEWLSRTKIEEWSKLSSIEEEFDLFIDSPSPTENQPPTSTLARISQASVSNGAAAPEASSAPLLRDSRSFGFELWENESRIWEAEAARQRSLQANKGEEQNLNDGDRKILPVRSLQQEQFKQDGAAKTSNATQNQVESASRSSDRPTFTPDSFRNRNQEAYVEAQLQLPNQWQLEENENRSPSARPMLSNQPRASPTVAQRSAALAKPADSVQALGKFKLASDRSVTPRSLENGRTRAQPPATIPKSAPLLNLPLPPASIGKAKSSHLPPVSPRYDSDNKSRAWGNGISSLIRVTQIAFAGVVLALYGVDLAQGYSLHDPRWMYAMFVGSYTVLYIVIRSFVCMACDRDLNEEGMAISHFLLDGLLWLFWLVLFGIFGYLYIRIDNASGDAHITRMKQAAFIDMAGWLSFWPSFFTDLIRYIDWD